MASSEITKYTASDGVEVELTPESVARLMVSGGGNCTDAEIASFIAICRARGLNPIAHDAYLIKYGNGAAVTQVGKDFYVRTARQQDDFDGVQAGIIVVGADGKLDRREGSCLLPGEQLAGGWAVAHIKGVSYPSTAEVSLGEYNSGKSLWASKPATMIRKVALVQALREGWPAQFAGVYDSSEIAEARAEAAPTTAPKARRSNKAKPKPATAEPIGVEATIEEVPETSAAAPSLNPAQRAQMHAITEQLAKASGQPAGDCARAIITACGTPVESCTTSDGWRDYLAAVETFVDTYRKGVEQ